MTNDEITLLLKQILHETGLNFFGYKKSSLYRRFLKYFQSHGFDSYKEYQKYLKDNEKEGRNLINNITVKVTNFFRDIKFWDSVKRYVIIPLIKKQIIKKNSKIRVWSIGCAGGEEVYSLAILFREALSEKIDVKQVNNIYKNQIEIYGTDININALKEAKKGEYSINAVKNVPIKFRKKYFIFENEKQILVKDNIKQVVRFNFHSITGEALYFGFDFIVCRNLFIYFTRNLQNELLHYFHRAIKPGGFLWLGKAETLTASGEKLFVDIDKKTKIYRVLK